MTYVLLRPLPGTEVYNYTGPIWRWEKNSIRENFYFLSHIFKIIPKSSDSS